MRLYSKRLAVRNRIIARNIPIWQLRTTLVMQQIALFGTGGLVFLGLFQLISIWWFGVGLALVLLITSLYARLWFKMLSNMKNGPDRIFIKKMIGEEPW